MKWDQSLNIIFKESKFFVFFSILIILVSITVTYYNISILKDNHNLQVQQYKKLFIENKKYILKQNINSVIEYIINDGIKKNLPLEKIKEKLSNIRYENGRYIFVFIHKEGESFMTPVVNPNRPDWIGKRMDLDNIKDPNGHTYMKSVIEKMNTKDGLYSIYKYKEPNSNKISKKISYIKKFPELNWYVGTGIHLSYMKNYLEKSIQDYEEDFNKVVLKAVLFASLSIFIFSAFLFFYNRKFYKTYYELNQLKSLIDNIKKRSKVWYWIYDKENFTFDEVSKIKNISESFNNLKDLFTSVHPNDFTQFVEFFEDSLKAQKEGHIEFRLIIDEKVKYYEYTTKKIYNDSTGKLDLMGIFNDKTEQKTIEMNILKRKISATNSRMEKDVNKIINIISHQWRHPISYINSKLIDIYLDDFDKESFIEEIENSTEFMSETIDDFIGIMNSNNDSKEFYLSESINKVIKIFESELIDVDIDISISSDLKIKGDRSKFSQVFLNMLNNSLEAFRSNHVENKRVSCSISNNKSGLHFIYKDNAGGISKEKIDKVFDLFYSTKNNSHNKGLGFYIMKVIVEEHLNGEISLKNKDQGLEITLLLKPFIQGEV